MRAISYMRYGGPDVLHVEEVPRPTAKEDEVLVRVKAVEATKGDCEMRSFSYAVKWFWLPLRIALGVRRPRRQILGMYFSGEIVSTGAAVTRFSPGDAVFGTAGFRMGAYAEYLAVPQRNTIITRPRNMEHADAAAVPLGGLNALHFMRRAAIRPGERVLINGAGGSIGLHALQIAKAMGADVTVVDHTIKEAALLRLGADRFIDYTRSDFAAEGQRYDVVFDMVPRSSYSDCIRILNPGGRYLCGNPRLSVMIRSLFTSWLTDKSASFAFATESMEELETLKQMIEDGKIRSIVDKIYPMDEAAAAHRRVETEQRLGAVVISIGD